MTVNTAAIAVRPGEIVVRANCWSCGVELAKAVRRQPSPRFVTWSCDDCEVSWSARTPSAPR